MVDLLKGVDIWFLIFLVVVLGFVAWLFIKYFIYSIKQLFSGLQDTITELKDLIKELFEDRNNHSERIKALEIRCEERHCERK